MDCVEVRPIDCLDERVDCGVCEPESKISLPDAKPGLESGLGLNVDCASVSQTSRSSASLPDDAKEFDGAPRKLDQYFVPIPGKETEQQVSVNRAIYSPWAVL